MPSCEDGFMIFSTRRIKLPSKSELNGIKVRKSEERKKIEKRKNVEWTRENINWTLPGPDGLAIGSFYFLVLVVTLMIAKINLECRKYTFWEAKKAYIVE